MKMSVKCNIKKQMINYLDTHLVKKIIYLLIYLFIYLLFSGHGQSLVKFKMTIYISKFLKKKNNKWKKEKANAGNE